MSIELKVYQGDKLAAKGEIDVDRAIIWLVDAFSPIKLANGFSPSVRLIERNHMVLSNSYFTVGQIDSIVKADNFEQFDDYGWRYELTGTPEKHDDQFKGAGITNDFDQLKNLIWTYAKAWGQEYPDDLGNVIDQLIALEGQLV